MCAMRKNRRLLCIFLAGLLLCLAGCGRTEGSFVNSFFDALLSIEEVPPATEPAPPATESVPTATESMPAGTETAPIDTAPMPTAGGAPPLATEMTEPPATEMTEPPATEITEPTEETLPIDQIPTELLELLEKNPETLEFVRDYPIKKDIIPEYDLEDLAGTDSVPLLLQWDERWGYTTYAGELMGLSGCGPTCLSMVYIYLTGDTQYDPAAMAQFSQRYGFSVDGKGSAWSLMSKGATRLGLEVTEIPLDKNRVFCNLEAGNPIICIMGPGHFTSSGHFIVLTGCEDGKIRVNDPNSRLRSEKLWEFEDIKSQIRNLWVFRA